MTSATLLSRLGSLNTLPGTLHELLEASHFTLLDFSLCALAGLFLLWLCAIARTSIRDACRTRRAC